MRLPVLRVRLEATALLSDLLLLALLGSGTIALAQGDAAPANPDPRPAAGKIDYAPVNPPGYYILTPPPAPEPRINGARVFGVRPGSVFLFTVAATGEAPLSYAAEGLPEGLTLDAATGRITGVIRDRTPKTHRVTLRAKNSRGTAERELRIVVGDRIALTPPLGWNSWNAWARVIDDAKVRASAEAMARLLKGHGWTYVNIDDTWQGQRGGPYNAIQPNEKFPDMQKLADDIHALGLKFGIYSTPWTTSYGSHIGGSADTPDGAWTKPRNRDQRKQGQRVGQHFLGANDARQWAEWGVDYLKYDWSPNDFAASKQMADVLAAQPRDIVYSLSNTVPFHLGARFAKLANVWRVTGDIRDVWFYNIPESFNGVYDLWLKHERWAPVTGPGHWADPDMLVVGQLGWGRDLRPSKLTPDEQYSHLSLWALWAAPMLIGCPLENLDDFTLNLLRNDEVLAVNQDPLGRMAVTIYNDRDGQVLAKPMEDGSVVVGLFNRGPEPRPVTLPWDMIVFPDLPQLAALWTYDKIAVGITHEFRGHVRDLWRQKDVGVFTYKFTAVVPPHGVVLVRIRPAD